jgi:hypothetical protein
MNAGVHGLAGKLVPITALNVRVCRYGRNERLLGRGVLVRPLAAQFEDETNRLPTFPPSASEPPCPIVPRFFLVTFASDREQVTIGDPGGCHGVTNGDLDANPTANWRGELLAATASHDAILKP